MALKLAPTRSPERTTEPLVHLAPPPYEKSYCGISRNGAPARWGAEVTCVVCASLRAARRR